WRTGAVGIDEVDARGEIEELLDALRESVELVVRVGVVVADPQRLAEVRERVQAVRRVGGSERVDVVEHLAPRRERTLDDEIGRGPPVALGHRDAVEDLEREDELRRRAPVAQDAYTERGVEEPEPREAFLVGAHLALERLEEAERREGDGHA